MQLVRNVRIIGFRSIQAADLLDLRPLTVLIGKNSSGKSNVLRALNLFFNGEIEPGRGVSFTRDYNEDSGRRKKKKEIAVEVDFELPATFKPRKELQGVSTWGSAFTIRRSWELDQRRAVQETLTVLSAGKEVEDAQDLARQFLGLITYRYVPNRSIPADLLRNESQAIADSIFIRMKGYKHAAALFKSFGAAASRMLSPVAEALEVTGSPLSSPSLVTAESIGQMLSMRGFQAVGPHGGAVQDQDWGSGHQAFFLYLILHLIDTSYARFWGWKQATIWGLEEPESGLHRDLETRLADQIREWTAEDRARLQVIQTSHSPVFTMASDRGYWVSLEAGRTTFRMEANPKLTTLAELEGVSGWTHPALSFPWNPVVLVEGHYDVEALYHTACVTGNDDLRFLTLPGLDPAESAGKDQIAIYLKKISSLIPNRPAGSPLIVLFDWDVSNAELTKARAAYGPDGDKRVIRMDPAYADPALGDDFKGIERFYPVRIVDEAYAASEFTVGIPKGGGTYSISQKQLGIAKGRLSHRLKGVTASAELSGLAAILTDIRRAI